VLRQQVQLPQRQAPGQQVLRLPQPVQVRRRADGVPVEAFLRGPKLKS
jgi:hypothetical protein